MLQVGDEVGGHRVDARLGDRPGGTLWRLHVLRTDQPRTVLMFDAETPEVRARALQEVRAQGRLQHPNVVRAADVLEAGAATGVLFDLGDTPNLDVWLDQERPGIPEIEAVFLGILGGLEHAHDLGVWHGELRPEHIVVEKSGHGPVARVSAWGVGRIIGGAPLSRPGLKPPLYLAPEQLLDNQRVDHRVDIFALGCVLYEMVGGAPAFDGSDPYAVVGRILSEGYTLPEQLRSGLPARFSEVIRRCMHTDRDRRFATCAQLRNHWSGAPAQPAPNPLAAAVGTLIQGPVVPGLDPPVESHAHPRGRAPTPSLPPVMRPGRPTPAVVEVVPDEPRAAPPPAGRSSSAPAASPPLPSPAPPSSAPRSQASPGPRTPPPTRSPAPPPRAVSPIAWVALVGAVGALALAMLLLVGAAWWWSRTPDTELVATVTPTVPREDTAAPPAAAAEASPKKANSEARSGGKSPESKSGAPKNSAAKSPSSATAPGTGSAPAAGAASGGPETTPAEPAVPGATAPLTVRFEGEQLPLTVELTCTDGLRERQPLAAGAATFATVPVDAQCKIYPKGGFAATTYPVKGGQTLTCSLRGTTTTCR